MAFNDDDLLIEILLWLPAKSLIRFKLVCKRWFSIISSHHFCHRHTLLHRHLLHRLTLKPSLLLCCLGESPTYFQIQQSSYGEKWVPYHFISTLNSSLIRGFSHGLFLLQCLNEHPPEDCHIYNPTTRESKRIYLNINDMYRCVMGLNLAFDPLKSPHYKIVCVRAARRRSSSLLWRSWWRRCQIEVYESETDAWKLCGEPFLAPNDMDLNRGIYWKGGIHWRGIYFDIHGSEVRKHPDVVFPADTRTRTVEVSNPYVESNDCLHYVAHFPDEKFVMVFELQSDYSEWSLKYRIDLDIFPRTLSVLSIIRQKNAEDDTLMLHEPGKVMSYKLIDKSVNEIINFGHEAVYKDLCFQFLPQHTFQYIETLAPP